MAHAPILVSLLIRLSTVCWNLFLLLYYFFMYLLVLFNIAQLFVSFVAIRGHYLPEKLEISVRKSNSY